MPSTDEIVAKVKDRIEESGVRNHPSPPEPGFTLSPSTIRFLVGIASAIATVVGLGIAGMRAYEEKRAEDRLIRGQLEILVRAAKTQGSLLQVICLHYADMKPDTERAGARAACLLAGPPEDILGATKE